MPERKNPNRRQFLQAGILAGAAAPAIVPSSVLGRTRVAPRDRITVGLTSGRVIATHLAHKVSSCGVG